MGQQFSLRLGGRRAPVMASAPMRMLLVLWLLSGGRPKDDTDRLAVLAGRKLRPQS